VTSPKPEWLPEPRIRSAAERVLSQHHPEGGVPVPIESVVEAGYQLDIVPVPGLRDSHDTDGHLSWDLRSIHVDDYVMEHYENRYRFTLAHELAHTVLHGAILRGWIRDWRRSHSLNTRDDWCAFILSRDSTMVSPMDIQAHIFAGYLLIPTAALQVRWRKLRSFLAERMAAARQAKLDPADYRPRAAQLAADRLCRQFEVSTEAMRRQIERCIKAGDLAWPDEN
jgi:hypothetical protein